MKQNLLLLVLGVFSTSLLFAQNQVYEFDFRHNNPNEVAKLLILLETGIDGSLGSTGFVADLNLGAIARYTLNPTIDLQTKVRKSYASFHFDPDYRKNFEIEGIGSYFIKDKTKQKKQRVIVSGTTEKSGGYVYTSSKFFDTELPQRNVFGFNAGINFKTIGFNPKESEYKGDRKNVNLNTISLIGGLQFKRINASVLQIKKPRVNRIYDNYTIMSIDGILAPINTFNDGITGEKVGQELRDNGFRNPYPIGARFTYSVFGSIPSYSGAKSLRYTFSSSIGVRPYLGFHFDFGIGVMILRNM